MNLSLSRYAAIAAIFSTVGAAYADEPSPENRALAEVLFREAKLLSDAKNFDQACPKFQESHRLDPKPGTILNLAVCHEKQGNFASAWVDYIEAATFAARAGQKEREKFAKDQAAKIEKQLSRLAIRVPTVTPGLVVKLDSAPVNDAAWGSATPINPGSHTVEATAPGFKIWSKTVTIEQTPGNVDIVVPELEKEVVEKPAEKPVENKPVENSSTNVTKPIEEKPKDTNSPKLPEKSGFNKPLWIGVAAGGVGLAGAILGTAFGFRTFDKRDAGNAECNPPPLDRYCTKKGIEFFSEAQTSASISTAGFIIGGVGIGAGAVLMIIGMRRASPTTTHAWVLPQVGPTGTGLSAGMSF